MVLGTFLKTGYPVHAETSFIAFFVISDTFLKYNFHTQKNEEPSTPTKKNVKHKFTTRASTGPV